MSDDRIYLVAVVRRKTKTAKKVRENKKRT